MNCNLTITTHPLGKDLLKRFGTNVTMTEWVWGTAVDSDKLRPSFVEFYKEKHNSQEDITIDSVDSKTLIDDMIDYFNKKHPDGNHTVLNNSDNASAPYGGASNRFFAVSRVGDELNDIVRQIKYEDHDFSRKTKTEWTNRAKARLLDILVSRLDNTKGVKYEDFIKLKENQIIQFIDFIEKGLGDNITEQDKVLIATCREMISNEEEFFDLVFNTSKLQGLTKEFEREDVDEIEEEQANDANNTATGVPTEEGTEGDNSVDITFRLFDHSGEYGTFMSHIGGTLNSTLNSYRKLKSTTKVNGEYDFNTDNCIGIAECFTAQEIAQVLYTRNYNNLDDFIESVKQAAEQIPGYEGLIQLYDDLKSNYDFAAECYTTFAKFVVGKKEVFRNENGLQIRLSNNASSKTDSLLAEYYNNIRSTALSYDRNYIEKTLIKDIEYIQDRFEDDYKFNNGVYNDSDIRRAISKLAEAYSKLFPGISDVVILNYVTRHNNAYESQEQQIQNIGTLLERLKTIMGVADDIAKAYNDNISSLARKNRKNKMLRNQSLANERFISSSEYEDTSEELAFDPINAPGISLAEIINLAKDLVNYSSVKIDLNSRNAAGNLSSDVINNSMISYLKNVLSSELNNNLDDESAPIKRFRDYKFRSKQYNFSNILIEQKEGDTIINYGLFREENGVYVPTEYFDSLIQFSQFNGVSDLNSGNSVLYADSTMNDYFVTAFESYLKSKESVKIDGKIVPLGNFLMRTPSDKPNNIYFTMPKYSTKNIKKFISAPEIDAEVDGLKVLSSTEANKLINTDEVPLSEEEKLQSQFDFKARKRGKTQDINRDDLIDILAGKEKTLSIKDLNDVKTFPDSDVAMLAVKYGDMIVYVKGTLSANRKKPIISNVEFYGIKGDVNGKFAWEADANGKSKLQEDVKIAIGNRMNEAGANISMYAIDRSNPVFQQMRNQFKQEMQDAATAIHKLFRNANGDIQFDKNNNPIIYYNGKQTIDRTQLLYDNYHWNGKELVDRSEPGKAKLTGKVFSSDKFTLYKDGEVINYMDDVISYDVIDAESNDNPRTINFLYGGASRLQIDNEGNVSFTDEQQAAIDDAIERFLIDYIDTTLARTERFRDIINEVDGYNEEDIINFVLNYRLAYYASNDLFEGNTKFYKNAQDFLKRAKEAQAGGVPYALADYNKPYFGQEKILVEKYSYLNRDDIQKKLSKLGLHDCKAYTTFKAVTISNTVRTNEEITGKFKRDKKDNPTGFKTIGRISQLLIDKFIEEGDNEKRATEKAFQIMKGFDSVKTNDAQSYITFEEWIRRIAGRGQLAKYMPLIEKIQDRSQPLSSDDIKEFIQVQKNFYYDMRYDEDADVMAPRQIKNAEFVLIPRLIEGTELEQVYNAMIEAGIDQLNTKETSKAGKSKTLKLWDNDGNLTQKALDTFKSQAKENADIFDYNFLYTQQETPHHMGEHEKKEGEKQGKQVENKFGLQISKKILDNIPQFIEKDGEKIEHPLYKNKMNIQNALCANIKESWKNLLTDLGVKLDNNDNIQFNVDELGNLHISGLNSDSILEKFKQELTRTGINSNLLDYVTKTESPDGSLQTIMPFYIGSLSSKMESVAQSVFNRNVTRQKLPGFHAAQITRIGFKQWKSENTRGYVPRELRNRPIVDGKQTGYIEVLMPYSAFGLNPNDEKYKDMTPEERDLAMLKELEEAGADTLDGTLKEKSLDKFIGYRIPTEAKMSSQVMKVVGFLPSEYGSTIVVPDDWVALTGSDFDIDSVYGIQYRTYRDSNGRLRKVQFKESFDVYDWMRYVSKNAKKKVNGITKESFDEAKQDAKTETKEEIRQERKSIYEDFKAKADKINEKYSEQEEEAWNDIDDSTKDAIRLVHKALNKAYGNERSREKYIAQLISEVDLLKQRVEELKKDYTEEELNNITKYAEIRENILNEILENTLDYSSTKLDYKSLKSKKLEDKLQEIKDKQIQEYQNIARENGLMLSAEWIATANANPYEYNTKEARDNYILDNMIAILEDPESLQEVLAQSQFRNLIDARDDILGETSPVAKQRKGRSCYDFIDQAEGFEDASAGMALKGMSVAADTFVSVCNTVRPTLRKGVAVVYDFPKLSKADFKKKVKEFEDRFNLQDTRTVTYNEKNKTIRVVHTQYGWSNDNKNIEDALITSYTAETTAHILDAIKEGAIPNVTTDSFGVYKLLPSIGIDFHTCVGFMMQPGVKRIIDKLNSGKSVYINKYINAIDDVIEELKQELLKTGISEGVINARAKDIEVLNYAKLKERFDKGISNTQEDLLFDYAIALKYKELNDIASQITAYMMVCNPDKYGAKQSIFATNKIFTDISNLVEKEGANTSVFNENFLDSVFPDVALGVDGYLQSSRNDSKYPSLHYYLKYSTATSIKVNSELFDTHKPAFETMVHSIVKAFARGKVLTEETYNNFSKYILNDVYKESSVISLPVSYDSKKGIIPAEGTSEEEIRRIYGFGRQADISYLDEDGNWIKFECKDVTNPTQEEIEAFAKLSPAQKVFYIKETFRDSLIGKHLKIQTYNSSKYAANIAGSQSIRFIEEGVDIEQVYEDFRKTYQNSNPLLVLTAMDLIKYSVVVEGLRTKQNAVSKTISNKVLYNDGVEGCGFIDSIKTRLKEVTSTVNSGLSDRLIHAYVKAHPDMKEIAHTYISPKDKKAKEIISNAKFEIMIINANDKDSIAWLEKHKIGTLVKGYEENEETGERNYFETFKANPYIQINHGKEKGKILYKIKYNPNTKYIYLYPLNKLQANESSLFSVNPENNRYMDEGFYEALIDDWNTGDANASEEYETFVNEAQERLKEAQKSNVNLNRENKHIDINSDEFVELKQAIKDHFDGTNESWLYLRSIKLELSGCLPNNAVKDPVSDKVIDNGQTIIVDGRAFRIWRPNTTRFTQEGKPYSMFLKYLTEEGRKKPIAKADKPYEELIQQARDIHAITLNPFIIRPVEQEVTDIRHSSITEDVTISDKAIRRQAMNGNKDAQNYVRQVNSRDIRSTKESVETNMTDVILSTAEYVTNSVEEILNGDHGLNYFTKDEETGELCSIASPQTLAAIKSNPQIRRKFLKTLLEAQRLIDTYKSFATFKYDDGDGNMKFYIDKITEAIRKLEDSNLLKQAEELYVNQYLTSITNNPNIKNNIQSLYDGFYMSSTINSWFNDLQEMGNPILQIITSSVMKDIRAKELQGVQRVKDFKAKLDDIKKQAAAEGYNVDWKKIVDDLGRWIDDYNEQFLDDLERLENEEATAYALYKDIPADPENILKRSEAFEKYLQKKLEFDKWKLKNIHQPLVEDYYYEMNKLVESMKGSDGKFREIYVEYCMLNDELKDILSHERAGTLEKHWDDRRKEIIAEIANLRSNVIRDDYGEYHIKEDFGPNIQPSSDPIIRRNQLLNTAKSAEALDNFYKKRNAINSKYFDYNERFGFQEQLDKCLQIVERKERRDPVSGRMILSSAERNQDEEYVKAKEWLYNNTTHKYSFNREADNLTPNEAKQILRDYYDGKLPEDKLNLVTPAAIKYFRSISGTRADKKAIYKTIGKHANAYDQFGVLDARKLDDEQLASIKAEQEARYGVGESSPNSERRIMHSATTDTDIFTDEFWQKMTTHGLTNAEYTDVVNKVNSILRKCLNSSTGVLETSKLSIDDIKEVLKQFSRLGYNPITKEFDYSTGVKSKTGVSKEEKAEVKKFIEENVEFVLSDEDQARFDLERAKVLAKNDTALYIAWSNMNYEYNESTGEFVPNHLLWGHPRPKKEVEHKYINKLKTAAIKILNESFVESESQYYWDKQEQMIRDFGYESEEYKAWYEANHVYNPKTKSMEPLVCWMTSEPVSKKGDYEPAFSMTDRVGKKEYRNENFTEHVGERGNFKSKDIRESIEKGVAERNPVDPDSFDTAIDTKQFIPDSNYDRAITPNKYEKELKKYVQEMLIGLATTDKAKKYLEKGYLPSKAIDVDKDTFATKWLKELAKGFGYIETRYGNNPMARKVRYDTDIVPDMPMLHQITTEDTQSRPNRLDYNSQEEFDKALKEYEDNKADIIKKNAEIHKAMLNHNWEDVLSEFINKAAHYNAIQENKYNLYYCQHLLNKIQNYYSEIGSLGRLSIAGANDNSIEYDKKVDENLNKQFENWLHRVIYDEYKLPQGKKLKYAALAQSITSNMYMTLNLKGGIANITVGESNILGEVWAKEHFNAKEWKQGTSVYNSGITSYARDAYSEKSTSLANAIIKGLNIVDYDEQRGIVTTVNAATYAQRLRDAMYGCQTVGEHYMQNSVMFALMFSNRLVPNPEYKEDVKNGEPEYILMTKEEYLQDADVEALSTICNKEEFDRYKTFIDQIKSDADVNKEYALYRSNHVRDFIMKCLSDKAEAFKKARKEFRDLRAKDFDNYDNLYSQMALGKDGTMEFANNSKMKKMHEATKDKEVSDAYTILGKFKQRAISINKKIHGNYGKLDAAQIESNWWGGIVMQYHKHIVPGFMKRWRTKGYYNEERGTIEKGSYIELYDFLRAPIKQIARKQGLNDGQINALESIKVIFSNITDYCHYLKMNGGLLSEHEKGNMRRVLGDACGMLLGLTVAILARLGWDDDDDSLLYNMMLYEADRLYSENNMWNPFGAWNEAKTLYSTPIAAQSWIGDVLNVMNNIVGALFYGDEYEPNFVSGRYAGRNKIATWIERRLPYWRQVASLRDLADNNRYYKRTSTLVDWVPKEFAEFVKH